MGMELFCTIFKIWMYWKLNHKTCIEDSFKNSAHKFKQTCINLSIPYTHFNEQKRKTSMNKVVIFSMLFLPWTTQALYSRPKFYILNTIALSFVFSNYCSIMN